IIRRLLECETVTFKGKFFEVNGVKLTPEPIQKPHPPIWVGGFTPPALRRAARYGDGFTAPEANRGVYDRYVEELRKQGKATSDVRFAGGHRWLIASNEPERTWNEAADHIIYQSNNYMQWAENAGQSRNPVYIRDRAHLRELDQLKVAEPEQCVKLIREYIDSVPITHYYSWTLPPGLPPSWAQPHLELFASKVIPAFR
ncbi:MAG: LLM class flavin-dependent oxidoreductase, partial [Candidatus Binataceae bacterium]